MKTTRLLFVGLIVVLVLIFAVVLYVLRQPETASTPLEALPLDSGVTESGPIDSPSSMDEESSMIEESGIIEGVVLFEIVSEESEASFTLDEILRGEPTVVVGVTDQIAAEIGVNLSNPSNSQVGVILVNARTFVTDNGFRNRAIQNEILDTGDFEFIRFTPTDVVGLPESIEIGESVDLQISGDLTIRDVTQSVTFETTVTLVSDSRLEGVASATVLRADFGLVIPSVPNVADVSEEVLLNLSFVAISK